MRLHLRPDERRHLRESARCDVCGHLMALHDTSDWVRCDVGGCRCDGIRIVPRSTRKAVGLTGVAPCLPCLSTKREIVFRDGTVAEHV